jgi:hypothetical protein
MDTACCPAAACTSIGTCTEGPQLVLDPHTERSLPCSQARTTDRGTAQRRTRLPKWAVGWGPSVLYAGRSTATLLGTLAQRAVPSGRNTPAAIQILAFKVPVAFQESGIGPHKSGLSWSHTFSRCSAGPKVGGSSPAGARGRPRGCLVQEHSQHTWAMPVRRYLATTLHSAAAGPHGLARLRVMHCKLGLLDGAACRFAVHV